MYIHVWNTSRFRMHPTRPTYKHKRVFASCKPPVADSTRRQDMKFLEVHSDMETKRNKQKAKTAIGGPWGLRYKHAGRLGGQACRRCLAAVLKKILQF